MSATVAETPCATGRCAYGEPCRCDYYATWIVTPPCPSPRRIRLGGYATGYRDGWKQGYAKGFHIAAEKKDKEVA